MSEQVEVVLIHEDMYHVWSLLFLSWETLNLVLFYLQCSTYCLSILVEHLESRELYNYLCSLKNMLDLIVYG